MKNYEKSNNINVFPSAFRTIKKDGKFTSEQNFINILNSITDIDSYVLEYDQSFKRIKSVVIHGYFFEFINGYQIPDNVSDLWFQIKVEKGSVNSNALVNFTNNSIELDTGTTAEDLSTSEFQGLKITEDTPNDEVEDDYSIHNLKVFENGNIINSVRLKASSVKYDNKYTVKDKIDTKQNELTAGDGITIKQEIIDDETITTIKIKDNNMATLESLVHGKGDDTKFIYFDEDGVAEESSANVGQEYTVGNSYGITRATYTKNGELKNGVGVYASINSPPSDNSIGQNGDIWLRYTN